MILLSPASHASPHCGRPFNSDKSLFRQYRGGSLYNMQTVSTPPSLFSHFPFYFSLFQLFLYYFAYSSSVGTLSFQSPCPNRSGGLRGVRRGGGDYDRNGMKGERKGKAVESCSYQNLPGAMRTQSCLGIQFSLCC